MRQVSHRRLQKQPRRESHAELMEPARSAKIMKKSELQLWGRSSNAGRCSQDTEKMLALKSHCEKFSHMEVPGDNWGRPNDRFNAASKAEQAGRQEKKAVVAGRPAGSKAVMAGE